MSEMEDRMVNALLLAFEKQSEPNENGPGEHVEEMLDGTVCLDGVFDLKEICRAVIAALAEKDTVTK